MKTSQLATLFLASSACAQQVKGSSNEFECTHLLLGSPKSRSTSIAKALCHALQKHGNTTCIHEPYRVRHELDHVGRKGYTVNYKSDETTLCKDMLFHSIDSKSYQQKIKTAITSSKNAVVFLNSDPVRSFVSMADLQFKQMTQRHGNLKSILNNRQEIDRFSNGVFTQLAAVAKGNGAALSQMKAIAQNHNVSFVEIEDENLSKNPTAELNRVLASWDKQPLAPNEALKMSPSVDLFTQKEISDEVFASSYQLASLDTWDTAEGDVFDPSIRSQPRDEKIQAMLDKYVADEMHPYFITTMNNYFSSIEKWISNEEKKYQQIPSNNNEL